MPQQALQIGCHCAASGPLRASMPQQALQIGCLCAASGPLRASMAPAQICSGVTKERGKHSCS